MVLVMMPHLPHVPHARHHSKSCPCISSSTLLTTPCCWRPSVPVSHERTGTQTSGNLLQVAQEGRVYSQVARLHAPFL